MPPLSVKGGGGGGGGPRERAVVAQPPRDEPVCRLVGREQWNGRQQPLSRANFAVCGGDRAVAASPDSARRHGTTALVFAPTELTPLGLPFRSALRASAGKRRRGLFKERSLGCGSITTRHAVAFNYVKKPDCLPSDAKIAHIVPLAFMSPLLWLRVWRAKSFSLCAGESLQSCKRTERVY